MINDDVNLRNSGRRNIILSCIINKRVEAAEGDIGVEVLVGRLLVHLPREEVVVVTIIEGVVVDIMARWK
jgi:hypothetical protein